MPSALEKLVKILKLERNQGYKNTAVIGGLGAFSDNWEPEAHKQAKIEEHHHLVEDMTELMRSYSDLESENERYNTISYMLDRIVGRVPPRNDFAPSKQWQSVSQADPDLPKKQRKGRERDKERRMVQRKVPQKRAKQQSARPAPTADVSSDYDMNLPLKEHSGADLRTEPRLERPPRQRRPNLGAEQAADQMNGLRKSVTIIKGVGAKLAAKLEKLGIYTLEDMLFYRPRRYDDYTRFLPIHRLQPDMVVTIIGTVRRPHLRRSSDFAFTFDDGSATMDVVCFGQKWMARQVREGQQLVLSGKTSLFRGRVQMTNPEWEPIDGDNLHTVGIVPVYGLTAGLNPRRFRKLMRDAVDYWAERIPDFVPEATLERTDLADLGWAIRNNHFPEGWDHLEHARRRLAFDELILTQLTILENRREWQSVPADPIVVTDAFLNDFVNAVFPYELTGAQKRAVEDILDDMARDVPMNRLLQGDVGSGKTAVAMIAMASAYEAGKQAALMAPTSILAEQHYRDVEETLSQMPEPPTVALLTGSLPKAERDAVYAGLADGSIDMVIGTHALIQEGVAFANLGMAVIDEQHRFGVEQRGALRGKGTNPHLLVMTATPIPRTLALTLYADLDLSIIDEMPPGRTPIETRIIEPVARERSYNFIKAQIDEGRQAFIVHPLVEASDKIEAASAVEAYETLQQVFYRYNVGLLHGKMKPDEKDDAMHAFAAGEYDVLVTTSVAEVGVNIPNASVMMIEGANRFGLSQLHQFRGRVGRGKFPGYCLLVPDTLTDESQARLEAMEETTDGFKLAEMDWKMRGAGDLVGRRQSGSNLTQYMSEAAPQLVEVAQREARTIHAADPELLDEAHRLLRQRVEQLKDARSDVS